MASYHVNQGPTGLYECVGVDYTVVVRAAAAATFTLFASAVDTHRSMIRTNVAKPIVVEGQFLQMDVLGVTAAP